MNLPNSVRISPVRLFVAALSLLCIPTLGQSVVASPAPSTPIATTPTPAPELLAIPAPADPAPAVAPAPSATVTATSGAATVPEPTGPSQMAAMNTAMTENMAKAEAADIARRASADSQQAGNKSDLEMKHAMIAQLQAMSDQIKQLDERITALSAQLEIATAKPVKAKPVKPAVRPPIKPVY